ncbi:hypothetical protein AAG906_018390 [Vitis piasezkii]
MGKLKGGYKSADTLNHEEAWVADLWSHSNGGGVWTHRFSRHPNNWEIEDAKHFFAKLLVKG